MSQYKLIFTNIGLSKKQNAELNNDYIEITEFAVGSGNIVNLLPTMTGLIHEEYRADINNVDTKNGTTVFDLIVPSSTGGFYIKEVALFDVDGDCICIGTVPITYKVNQDEGASKAIHLKVSTTSTNTENIVFNTDDSLVYATVSYVNNSVNTLRNEMLMELPKKVNVLDIKNNLSSNDTDKPLSAAQGKALKALINEKLGLEENAVSATKIKMDIQGTTCLELFNNTTANYTSMKELDNVEDAPNIGCWFIHSIRHSDSTNTWGKQIAYGWNTNANIIYQRTVTEGVWTDWELVGFIRNMIIKWCGSINNIPAGWYLCNGENGTPDLRNKFIYGASSNTEIGTTGGSADTVVVSHSHNASADSQGSHTHTAWTDSQGSHSHSFPGGGSAYTGGNQPTGSGTIQSYVTTGAAGAHAHNIGMSAAGAHAHNISIEENGVSGTNKNLPPYMKLAYIMKG